MPTLNNLDAIGGASAALWTSGETVTQWDYRKSPLDGEVYQRTTATGGGTTDPANDATNYAAVSFVRTSALSVKNGIDNNSSAAAQFANGAVKTAINGITAGTRTQVLNISGRGAMVFLALMKDATGGGRVEIIVDGFTILDTVTATATASTAHLFLGAPGSGDPGSGVVRPIAFAVPEGGGVAFRRTFAVWYTPATSASGANAILAYDLRSTR